MTRSTSSIPHLAFAINTRLQAQNGLIKGIPVLKGARTVSSIPTNPRLPRAPSLASPSTSQRLNADTKAQTPLPVGQQGRDFALYFAACCLIGFLPASYLSYVYVNHQRAVKATQRLDLQQDADVSNRWRDESRDFDQEVELAEKLGFMKAKRRRLVNEAYGNVLEVSVGTGRNMDLYDLRPYHKSENRSTGRSRQRIVSSLTFNDQSEVMVEHARNKFEAMEAATRPDQQFNGAVRFIVGDASTPGIIDRPQGGYDTIVQTMGVCSTANAVDLLQRLGNLCRQPGEVSPHLESSQDDGRGGKILLLEHGRGTWSFLNRFLDDGAKMHAAHYGCWWNKDIQRVVKDSGLVVDRMRRYNFGTTWEIVLRPAPRAA